MEHIKKEFQGLKMKQLLDKDTKKKMNVTCKTSEKSPKYQI
jgi:hypothetical protein